MSDEKKVYPAVWILRHADGSVSVWPERDPFIPSEAEKVYPLPADLARRLVEAFNALPQSPDSIVDLVGVAGDIIALLGLDAEGER